MIKDGIYKVVFSSNVGASGEGLVVLANGAINGGDFGYLYQGPISARGADVTATLEISQYNRAAQSVFGPLGNFTLSLKGSLAGANAFNVTGSVVSQPGLQITISGELLKPLAGPA